MAKTRIIRALQFIHLTIFLGGITIITILHLYTKDFWDSLRLPSFLKEIDAFLGYGWPASLYIYQIILLFSLFLALTNALGLFFYQSKIWRYFSDISSFIGFLIIWPVALFFLLTLVSAPNLTAHNIQTIFSYFVFSFLIFLLDLVTWYFDDQNLLKLKRSRSLI